ncbi:IS66 family insertion sequence element accessory protein TnpB [Achromobacter xylosoxidans]|uniref:IS66 family insertion sequence element accessory protein TnpB n=1 Tax=Alcaligenes xylosoxydans xylosoxydans TaxID=85698 RepID=A0A9X3KV60_ALCXX|nr:IS66 family insertion sequence element accessory protein TnpB [Achromobacter xylosoxidans]MCZ8400552.1 IS66 family insertion sequence element accessory protein TnpB [Achromobacter xylosoxidans]
MSACGDPCRCDLAGHGAAGHACGHRDGAGAGGRSVRCCTAHHAYCFVNRRANRMKVLVHDGIGVWLAARRLNRGKFTWTPAIHGPHMALDGEQWQALVLGLPWQPVGAASAISVLQRLAIGQDARTAATRPAAYWRA